jgi:cobalt/nickel transport system permease protein
MHMADALLSPAVGGTMWAATAGMVGYCARKLRKEEDDRKVPLMGVLGAFVFAAQMINFTIPGTGSSGHLGGGILLAILLGPEAAFLVMSSILTVQALLFADGGLLALGANIFNLGFLPCFVAYPLVYRRIAGDEASRGGVALAAILASVVGLQLGAFGVVVETVTSGISEIPFGSFLLLMLPIHLAIGLVEGAVTAGVLSFVLRAQPEVLEGRVPGSPRPPLGKILAVLGILALVTGGALSWFASTHPDGLEWAVARVTGTRGEVSASQDAVHGALQRLQEKVAPLPGYGFKAADEEAPAGEAWPAVDPGTSLSGIVGGGITLLLAGAVGWILRHRSRIA